MDTALLSGWIQIFFKQKLYFFTSISAFHQARFCLIPIAEGSSAGTSILFIVLWDKECLVTSYQRRLCEESKN